MTGQKKWRKLLQNVTRLSLVPLLFGVTLVGCSGVPAQSVTVPCVQPKSTPIPAPVTADSSQSVSDYSEKVRNYSAKVSDFLQRVQNYLRDSQETKPH